MARTAAATMCMGATLALALGGAQVADARPKPAADEQAQDSGKKAAKPAKVVLSDKAELKDSPSDSATTVKKLHANDKLEFVEYSPDGKWAKVKKSKAEGWLSASVLTGLPPFVAASASTATTPTANAQTDKPASSTPAPAQTVAETPTPAATPVQAEPAKPASVEPPKPVPVAPPPVVADNDPPAPTPESRLPLSGFFLSVGGGAALLNSGMSGRMASGLAPELYNYDISNLPSLGLQARMGYTFGYKMLRVGVDAGYRFAGATSIVVQLPDRDSLPMTGVGGAMTTVVLKTPRQEIATTAHDADAALTVGVGISLPKQLALSIRARGGFNIFAFAPEFNSFTPLPQEIFYGPHVGGNLEFASRNAPGFGLRVEGGYIPYAVRQQNTGLRDGDQKKSTGYFIGGAAAVRVIRGFDIEVAYRMLSTSTDYNEGSVPERLIRDRDPSIQARARAGTETIATANRYTGQQTISVSLVFFRN